MGWLGSWVPCKPGCRLAAWPRGWRMLQWWLMVSEMDGRPMVAEISSFLMNWCHLLCSNCLWHYTWKASRDLESTERRVRALAAFNDMDCTSLVNMGCSTERWRSSRCGEVTTSPTTPGQYVCWYLGDNKRHTGIHFLGRWSCPVHAIHCVSVYYDG